MNKPKPSLCDKLIARLEESLCGVHSPASADIRDNAYEVTLGLRYGPILADI